MNDRYGFLTEELSLTQRFQERPMDRRTFLHWDHHPPTYLKSWLANVDVRSQIGHVCELKEKGYPQTVYRDRPKSRFLEFDQPSRLLNQFQTTSVILLILDGICALQYIEEQPKPSSPAVHQTLDCSYSIPVALNPNDEQQNADCPGIL
ncbi:hypothetical protein JR316_0005737 [Psilocybe cubensis]|uniref:Uncharacterized protein n=2 Tax=Psilocybe cubensis TaxID=181762 RepID=A0ACB8H055_PSICU|nr:hypothetical protein JR316_0005737 [Psilocybe cubensis]KAH9481216.1 hypothetical protein JR316_0005737 [Psilocybe cubensis]